MNIARMIGAGPLIVIDTDVVGAREIEAGVQLLHVVERRDADAGIADLAVDVRTLGRIFAVQRDRIERGRQARGLLAVRQVMEAAVGALGRALAGEHARRDPRRCGDTDTRHRCTDMRPAGFRLHQEAQQVAPALVRGRCDLRDLLVRQRFDVVVAFDRLAAHFVGEVLVGDRLSGAPAIRAAGGSLRWLSDFTASL